MKKQVLAIAASVLVLAACHNGGSSTVGEKDQAYPESFNHEQSAGHEQKEGHEASEAHTAPADHTQTGHADTSHATADSTHH